MGQSARTATIGTVFGLAGAIGFGRLLRSLLFGLSPTDPLALAGSLAILAASVVLASWVPARKASAIDPAITLREE